MWNSSELPKAVMTADAFRLFVFRLVFFDLLETNSVHVYEACLNRMFRRRETLLLSLLW